MSDNREDSREGSGDRGDRTDDRTALWDRAIGLLLGHDPVSERGARGGDRPTWEETVDERGHGDERNRVRSRAGDPAAGSHGPSTGPDTGSHGYRHQDTRPRSSDRRERDRGERPPERQVTQDQSGQSRASRPPDGQRHRRGRSPRSGPREDERDRRAGGSDQSARQPDRTPSGTLTLSRRHQIGEWVPRGQIHRHTGGPPRGRSVAHAPPEPRDGGEGYDEPQEVDPDQVVEPEKEEWECRRAHDDPPSEAWEATLRDRRPDRRQHRRWKRQFVTISGPATETEPTEESEGDSERDESDDTSRVRLR